MPTKERNQNPVVGDTINLRLITLNSNNLMDVSSIEKVEIYQLDPAACSETNKDGRTLVETIASENVVKESTGTYLLSLKTSAPKYTISKYLDSWHLKFRENDPTATSENNFEIYPDLWYTSTIPAVYGFDFQFQPNRIRKGSKKWLIIKIIPNVPRSTELERYYSNLAISATMKISIELNCGPCVPEEVDLRLLVDKETVTVRDKVFGYYLLDATDDGPGFDCGIYNVWFELEYGGTIEVSQKMQVQIF